MKNIFSLMLVIVLCLGSTNPLLAQWLQTNGPNGGDAGALAATPGGTLFALIENDNLTEYSFGIQNQDAIYRSTDNGAGWTEADSGLGTAYIYCLVIAPGDSDLYAGTNHNGIFRSTNEGKTWNSIGLTDYAVKSLAVSPDDSILFAGTDYNGVFHSTNRGTSWIKDSQLKTSNVSSLLITPGDSTFYTATDGGVAMSSDAGKNWQLVGLMNLFVRSLAVSPDYTTLYAGTAGNGVYRSVNNGTTWSQIGMTNYDVTTLTVLPDDSTLFAGANYGGIFKFDGGNWTQSASSGVHANSLLLLSGKSIFAGTVVRGIYRSTDYGKNWIEANSGISHTDAFCLAVSPDDSTIAAGTGIGLFLTTNNGSTWTRIGSTFYTVISLAFSPDGNNLYAGTDQKGLFHYTRNGSEWIKEDSSLAPGNLSVGIISLAFTSGGTLFAGTTLYTGGIETYLNNKWTLTNQSLMANGVRNLAVSGDGNTVFAVSPNDETFLSTDGGGSWTQKTNIQDPNAASLFVTSLAVASGGILLTGTRYNGIYRSTDNGQSWIQINLDPGATNLHITSIAFTAAGELLTATEEHGIYQSTDNGKSWTSVNTGLTSLSVNSLAAAAGGSAIFAGISHAGVWEGSLSELTAVQQPSATPPAKFELGQNYPNPFNPETKIRYSIPLVQTHGYTYVRLEIFDLLGREIATLVNERQQPGNYEVNFNGSRFASGVYIYVLRSGDNVTAKKMILLK